MKRPLLIAIVLATFAATAALPQTKPEQPPPEQLASKPKVVALNTNELEPLPYDAGKVRFIATSEDTNSAYAVVELTEMPGYNGMWSIAAFQNTPVQQGGQPPQGQSRP